VIYFCEHTNGRSQGEETTNALAAEKLEAYEI
jgi:hypothetical protein